MGTGSKRPANYVPKRRTSFRLPLWLWLVPLAVVAGIGLIYAASANTQASGTITPERTSYDFGDIKYSGGLVTTKFALQVKGAVVVKSLSTT